MLLYDENVPAPNPRRVRIFLAEKGLTIPIQRAEMAKGEHKSEKILKLNSLGALPTLELDDGSGLGESISICRYLEALHPEPPMFGRTPKEIGLIDMWIRRAEMQLMAPLGAVWINNHPYTKAFCERAGIARHTAYGEDSAKRAVNRMQWIDQELGDREFLATDRYSMADALLLTVIDFAKFIDIEMPDDCSRLRAWHARVSARPSAAA